MEHSNPYAAPLAELTWPLDQNEMQLRHSRWRLIPVTLFPLFGVASLFNGLFLIFSIVMHVYLFEIPLPPNMWVLCTLFLGVGFSWTLASRYYWNSQFLAAIMATVLGCLIPMILYSIFGP